MRAASPERNPDQLLRSGAALREAIRRAGLSYEAVAHRLGLKGRSSISQWCSGSIPTPIRYHSTLRRLLRAPQLFPDTPLPTSSDREYPVLRAVLHSYASMQGLPLDLVERSSWEVWTSCTGSADWHSAGQYVAALEEAVSYWRVRQGYTSRRLERIRWAAAHGQLRAALYTCDWEGVEQLSRTLREEIYRSGWLDVLDHPEQALILNTLSLADFFLRSRFRRPRAGAAGSSRVSALRQALTAALNHLGEAERRLRLPQDSARPVGSPLRLEVAQLLLDATEASMVYEAREDPSVATTLVLLADRVAAMAGRGGPDPVENEVSREYRQYLFEEIFPRIELECRYNAAVIGALEERTSDEDRVMIARSTAALENLAQRSPSRQPWRSEFRMTELFRILSEALAYRSLIPREVSLRMRHALDDLREDFYRSALMGVARSAASVEILLDVNLARQPDCAPAEQEERLHSAAELVDWMDSTLESFPDAPTALVVQWDRAALTLLSGVREASTVRDLVEVYSRLREYGGLRIPKEAARVLQRIAAGEFGARAAAAVPAGVREGLPVAKVSEADPERLVLVLAPLLYPMMPISFIRPQGYEQPSAEFWGEPLPYEDTAGLFARDRSR